MSDEPNKTTLLTLAAQIVAAHVSHNNVAADALPSLITSVFKSLSGADKPVTPEKAEPAVPIKKSVFNDHIICLDCGQAFKTIRRHLNTDHELTPEAYREKWGLPRDYPMTAPAYSAQRSALAKELGLGRKAKVAPEPKVIKVPAEKRGRPKKIL